MQIRKLLSAFGQNRLMGGAIVLAIWQLSASVMGLVRDRILTATFPGLGITDVYIASFRPSDLFFQMTVMAGFSVALVPLLASYRAREDSEEMTKLFTSALSIAAITFGILALALSLALPHVAPYLTNFQGEKLDLYIAFGRLALLTNFLFVFGNACGQYLITVQRYWIYGVTPVLYTLGTIVGTLYLTPHVGAFGPMYGTLGGAILYVLLRGGGVLFHGSFTYSKSALWHSDLKEMFWLMLPRMVALGALQAELLFFDSVASGLDTGSVTINAYARNFQSVAVGMAGIALAQSAFSLLSQAASSKEERRFKIYLSKGVKILLAVTIPGAIVLHFLAPVAAVLVKLSHVFSTFSVCLSLYCISIPFESLNHLLLRSFYALKETVLPALFSVINGTIAIVAAIVLAPLFGVYAIAIGFTIGQIAQLIGLSVLLPGVIRKNSQ